MFIFSVVSGLLLKVYSIIKVPAPKTTHDDDDDDHDDDTNHDDANHDEND